MRARSRVDFRANEKDLENVGVRMGTKESRMRNPPGSGCHVIVVIERVQKFLSVQLGEVPWPRQHGC